MSEPTVEELVARLNSVTERLRAIAAEPVRLGLTAPEPETGEQWAEGQVWAHMSEFPRFWMGEVEQVLSGGRPSELRSAELVKFGRGDDSPVRLDGIASRRTLDKAVLFDAHVEPSIRETVSSLQNLSFAELEAKGLHVLDGEMTVRHIVAHYVVDHLEEHAEQAESLQ